MSEEQNRFSLRKLSIGLASVLVGVSIFGTSQTVKADTVADNQTSSVTNNAQSSDTQENKNVAKSSFSSDNQANNVKSNLIQTQVEGKKDQKQDSVPKTQEATDSSNLDAEKSIVRTSSLQEPDNQSNNHAEDNSQAQNEQKLDITKNSKLFDEKELATNLTKTNNKLTHSYTKQGSDPSVVKTPPKSLLASDNFDYSGTTTIQWNPKMTKGLPADVWTDNRNSVEEFAYSNTDVDGVVATASITLTGNNYIIDPNTGNKTRIAKINRVLYDLKYTRNTTNKPRVIGIYNSSDFTQLNVSIYGHANQLSEYMEYLDDQGNKINIPLAYDIQIIGSLDGDYDLKKGENECVKGINGSIVYPYTNAEFINNDPNTNAVRGWDTDTTESGQALAIGGLTNGLTFYKNANTDGGIWDRWSMGLATPSQMQNLPYSEIDTRESSRNIHFVDENGNQIQPTLTQTASWVSVKDKQGNIKTIGNQPNIAEYNIPHELTANGKTYLIDAFTDGNSTKLASWTPANTDKNQDVYLVYKNAAKVQVNYVDNVTQKIVKSDTFTSPVGADYDYNVSAPDGYLLINRNKKNYTGVTPSDDFTINIQMRKAIQRHYNFIETQPDGTKKTLVSVEATFVQRTDGNWGVPDFTADGDLYPANPYSTENDLMKFTIASGVNNKGHVYADWDTTLTGFDPNDKSYIIIYPDSYENYATVNSVDTSNDNPQGISFYKANNPTIPNTTNAYVLDILTGVNTYSNILPSKDFDISYERTKPITDPDQLQSMGKRTITITFPNGNAETIVQTVGFKRTGVLNLTTNKATYTDWVFDADTSNVTVDGQVSTQYQAYVLKDGVVNYAPIKLPHINGYKAHLVRNKINPAMLMVSFMAVPSENKPSLPNEETPSKPSANADNTNKPADDLKDLKQRVVTELNSNDSGWTMPTTADTHVIEVPTDSVSIDLSNLVIAEPVHAHTHTQIRVTKRFKLSKKHSIKHLKHRKKAVRTFRKYRL